METHYDKEANVLLIRISNSKPEYGEDVGNGIVVHFDKNKNPVEIEILDAKKANPETDTKHLESQIDQMVYKLYGLTKEEIAIVEGHNEAD